MDINTLMNINSGYPYVKTLTEEERIKLINDLETLLFLLKDKSISKKQFLKEYTVKSEVYFTLKDTPIDVKFKATSLCEYGLKEALKCMIKILKKKNEDDRLISIRFEK